MNFVQVQPVVVTIISLVANEAPELARITLTSASGARTIVSNSRMFDREALTAGRDIRRLDRDSLQLARVTFIHGREARPPGREAH
jgi:hypothetical protein